MKKYLLTTIPLLIGLFLFVPRPAEAADMVFPPANIDELVGASTCSLPSDSWIGGFRLPLNDEQGHALEYRKKGDFEVVMLLAGVKNPSDCAEIVTVLKLPRHEKGETIEFDCFLRADKGRQDGVIIGLADNGNGKYLFASARVAWSIDLQKQKFEPINNKPVICDTQGYKGWPGATGFAPGVRSHKKPIDNLK